LTKVTKSRFLEGAVCTRWARGDSASSASSGDRARIAFSYDGHDCSNLVY
jgi:hypothetical protein